MLLVCKPLHLTLERRLGLKSLCHRRSEGLWLQRLLFNWKGYYVVVGCCPVTVTSSWWYTVKSWDCQYLKNWDNRPAGMWDQKCWQPVVRIKRAFLRILFVNTNRTWRHLAEEKQIEERLSLYLKVSSKYSALIIFLVLFIKKQVSSRYVPLLK